jgi:hypothetical protein
VGLNKTVSLLISHRKSQQAVLLYATPTVYLRTQEQTTCTNQRFRMYQQHVKRKYRKVSHRTSQIITLLSASKTQETWEKICSEFLHICSLIFTSWFPANYNHSLPAHAYCFSPVLPATVPKFKSKSSYLIPTNFFFPLLAVQQSNLCLAHLFFKVSRSHTIRHTHLVGFL